MKRPWAVKQTGFTIVELLIVIVIIAILASITIVAFNGIQARANNTAVTSDLKNIADQLEIYKVTNDVYPAGTAQLSTIDFKVSKSAYGNNLSSLHNLLYCRVTADGPDKFALIARGVSGTLFTYQSTTGVTTTSSAGWPSTSSTTLCQGAGINQTIGTDRDFFFYNGSWMSYVGG